MDSCSFLKKLSTKVFHKHFFECKITKKLQMCKITHKHKHYRFITFVCNYIYSFWICVNILSTTTRTRAGHSMESQDRQRHVTFHTTSSFYRICNCFIWLRIQKSICVKLVYWWYIQIHVHIFLTSAHIKTAGFCNIFIFIFRPTWF